MKNILIGQLVSTSFSYELDDFILGMLLSWKQASSLELYKMEQIRNIVINELMFSDNVQAKLKPTIQQLLIGFGASESTDIEDLTPVQLRILRSRIKTEILFSKEIQRLIISAVAQTITR